MCPSAQVGASRNSSKWRCEEKAAGAVLEVDQRRTSELSSVGADQSAPVVVEARACIVPAVAPAEAAVMAVSEVPPVTEPAVPEAAALQTAPASAPRRPARRKLGGAAARGRGQPKRGPDEY